MKKLFWRVGVLAVSLVLVASCGYVRITRRHLGSEAHAPLGPEKARGVIVLLPGFGDRASAFEKNGFIKVLHERAPDYDVVAADAHFGYYRKAILVPRLEEDVIGPLRNKGYREIWLSGASMGGFGAVGYARSHPQKIAGLLLFAPYMGPATVTQEAKRAGGLCKWEPPAISKVDSEETFARANLAWLKSQACDRTNGKPIFVGVGNQDRLLPANDVLAAELDPSHFLVLPGGHGWKVWTPALDTLAARAFPQPSAVMQASTTP
jgi:hypothetical protein